MEFEDSTGMVKFCLRVSPHMFSSRQTYIPHRLIHTFPGNVPEEIKFIVSNGDVFGGHLIPSKHCFVGLRKLLRHYRDYNISLLCFEYVGSGEFSVIIFDSAAVEIQYPQSNVRVSRPAVESDKIPEIESYKFSEVYTLQDYLNKNLLTFNAADSDVSKIFIYMPEHCNWKSENCVVLDKIEAEIPVLWENGSGVFFEVFNKCWQIIVRKRVGKWCFCDGWKEFAKDVNVSDRDMIVLSATSSSFCFDVAIYKDYASIPVCIERQLEVPQSFIKTATYELISKAELVIPRLFLEKYQHEFDKEITIVGPFGFVYFRNLFDGGSKLTGLEELIEGSYLRVGYTLVFTKVSSSQLNVSVYDDQLIEISTS